MANDLIERRSRSLIRTRYANNVGARLFHPQYLGNRRSGVVCQRVGHRLDGDWRVSANLDGSYADFA